MNFSNTKTNLDLSALIKQKRKESNLTQVELADLAGVGLRFIRELEQKKPTLRMDKVNEVLAFFGYELGPVPLDRSKYLDNEKS